MDEADETVVHHTTNTISTQPTDRKYRVPRGYIFQGLPKPVFIGGCRGACAEPGSVVDGVRALTRREDTGIRNAVEIQMDARRFTPDLIRRASQMMAASMLDDKVDAIVINDRMDGEEVAPCVVVMYLTTYCDMVSECAIDAVIHACKNNTSSSYPRPMSTRAPHSMIRSSYWSQPYVSQTSLSGDVLKVVPISTDHNPKNKPRGPTAPHGGAAANTMQALLQEMLGSAASAISASILIPGDVLATTDDDSAGHRRWSNSIRSIIARASQHSLQAEYGSLAVCVYASSYAKRVIPMHLWSNYDMGHVIFASLSLCSPIPYPERTCARDIEGYIEDVGMKLVEYHRHALSRDYFIKLIRDNYSVILQNRDTDACCVCTLSDTDIWSVFDINTRDTSESGIYVYMCESAVIKRLSDKNWFSSDHIHVYHSEGVEQSVVYTPRGPQHDGPPLTIDYSYRTNEWVAVPKYGGSNCETVYENPLDIIISANGQYAACAACYIPADSIIRVHGIIRSSSSAPPSRHRLEATGESCESDDDAGSKYASDEDVSSDPDASLDLAGMTSEEDDDDYEDEYEDDAYEFIPSPPPLRRSTAIDHDSFALPMESDSNFFRYFDVGRDDRTRLYILPVESSVWVSSMVSGVFAPVGRNGQFISEHFIYTSDPRSANSIVLHERNRDGVVYLRVVRGIRPGEPISFTTRTPSIEHMSTWHAT